MEECSLLYLLSHKHGNQDHDLDRKIGQDLDLMTPSLTRSFRRSNKIKIARLHAPNFILFYFLKFLCGIETFGCTLCFFSLFFVSHLFLPFSLALLRFCLPYLSIRRPSMLLPGFIFLIHSCFVDESSLIS